jgi:hypothetical protein
MPIEHKLSNQEIEINIGKEVLKLLDKKEHVSGIRIESMRAFYDLHHNASGVKNEKAKIKNK